MTGPVAVRQSGRYRRVADLPILDVHPDPENLRRQLADLEELAASMAEHGLVQPVVVRSDPDKFGYTLVAGHRRYAAARALGWVTIPGVVRDPMNPADARELMLLENMHRVALDPVEEARALAEIMARHKFGAPSRLARFVGRSEGWVRDRLALLELDEGTQERVTERKVTIGAAVAATRQVTAAPKAKAQAQRKPPPTDRLRTARAQARTVSRALDALTAALTAEGVGAGEVPELVAVRRSLDVLLATVADEG